MTSAVSDLSLSPSDSHGGPSEFAALLAGFSEELANLIVNYDAPRRAVTAMLRPGARACMTQPHLTDCLALHAWLKETLKDVPFEDNPVRYLVSASPEPGVWCLGGDLNMFARCIRENDVEGLRRYAYNCCELDYNMHTCMGLHMISIVLVQGKSLGGGFEAMRSHNLVFAEEQSTFALPETMFNLFPGMGAYTFLPQFIGLAKTNELVMDGLQLTARELHALGGIERVFPDGEGVACLNDYIDKNGKRFSAHSGAMAGRRISMRVDLAEMYAITDKWVECAFRISETDLRTMERLVSAQDKLRLRQARVAA